MLPKDQEKIHQEISAIIAENGNARDKLFPTLQILKEHYGEIPDSSKQEIANIFDLPPVAINSILSFYSDDKSTPNTKLSGIFTGPFAFSHIASDSAFKAIKDKSLGFAQVDVSKLNKSQWGLSQAIETEISTIVANADDGEPFIKNSQALTENYLDLIIAGMVIAALASGAENGFYYLPNRLESLKSKVDAKLDEFRQQNFLGENILGKENFNFDIEVVVGMGAYTGRERSSLVAFLEGKRPEPSNPDRNFASYFIQQTEQFIWLAYLCVKDGKWPSNLTSELEANPKLISISGDCAKPGIYQFSSRATISETLASVSAEITKAILLGGYSGKFIEAKDFDQPIDSKLLSPSPAMIVYGADTDLLRTAKDILDFFAAESCGQCVPCRNGIPVLQKALNDLIYTGKTKKSFAEVRSLAKTIQLTSKCSLGQSAPNAFLSILDLAANEK